VTAETDDYLEKAREPLAQADAMLGISLYEAPRAHCVSGGVSRRAGADLRAPARR